MEADSLLTGSVSLLTGFSGADRIFLGDYSGGILKGLLFIATAAAVIYSPSGLKANANVLQATQFLMFLAAIWWAYDCLTLFMKMSSADRINNVFGQDIVWKNNDRVRYAGSTTLFFLFVALAALA